MAKNSMFIDEGFPKSDLNYAPQDSISSVAKSVTGAAETLFKVEAREKKLQRDIETKTMLIETENHIKKFRQGLKELDSDSLDTWQDLYTKSNAKLRNQFLKKYPNSYGIAQGFVDAKLNGGGIDVDSDIFTQRGKNFVVKTDEFYNQTKSSIFAADDHIDIASLWNDYKGQIYNDSFFDTLNDNEKKKYGDGFRELIDNQYIYKQAEILNIDGSTNYVATLNNLKDPNFKIYNLSEIDLDVSDEARINAGNKLETLAKNNNELIKVAYTDRANRNVDKLILLEEQRRKATDNDEIIDIDTKIRAIKEQLLSNQVSKKIYDAYNKAAKNEESNPIIFKDLTVLASMGYLPENFYEYAKYLNPGDFSKLVSDNRTAKEKNEKGENKQILDMKAIIVNTTYKEMGRDTQITGSDLARAERFFRSVEKTDADRLMSEEFLTKFALLDDIIQHAKENGISVRALIQDGRVFQIVKDEYTAGDFRYGDTTAEIENLRNQLYGNEVIQAARGIIKPDRPELQKGKVVINGIVQDQSYFNSEGKKITPTNYVATYQNYFDKTRKRKPKESLSNFKNRMLLQKLRMDRVSTAKVNEIKRILNVVED